MAPEKLDKHPYRTLVLFLAAGCGIFAGALFFILYLLMGIGGYNLDASVVNFYPLMAGAGGLFGFERWLYYESGGVNPFHDR